MDFVAWNASEERAGGGLATDHPELLPLPPAGSEWVQITGSCTDTTLAMIGGVRTEVPIALAADSALALARAEKLAAAKACRDARQQAGCVTAIGRVSTDFERSMSLWNNMVAAAAGSIAAKTAFPFKDWTLADGVTKVPLTPTKGVAANVLISAMMDACQQTYEANKAAVLAAPSLAALASIDVTAGYPA